ncbi:MAG: regulatory protein RecX, partial [Rikenellaceae bacterium]
ESDRVQILWRLIEMRFIDDRRFAELFVRDKCRLSGWGARRIASELMIKGIDRDIIDKELERLDSDKLKERLGELLERKLRTTKGKNSYEKRGKLLNYGARLGYDYSMMCEVIEQLNFNAEEECDEESLYF